MSLCKHVNEDGTLCGRELESRESQLCKAHNSQRKRRGYTWDIYSFVPDHQHRNVVGYRAAHNRVTAKKGKAKEYACLCGRSAQEWGYDHLDKNELVEIWNAREVKYSLDPEHYVALCHPCHIKLDRWKTLNYEPSL